MSQARFKIVFSGELMPAAQLDEVKANLARLFKSDSAKIDSLFSGTPVALKRDLGEDEAEKYLAALQRAGAKVYKETDLGASLSLVETEDHNPPAEATATTDGSRMSCPKCGHEQDKAAECAACGIIIDKYLARQAELAASAPTITVTSAVTDAAAPATPYAPPTANVAEALPDYADLKFFGIEGRIGRLRYLAWYLAAGLIALVVGGIFFGLFIALGVGSEISLLTIAVGLTGALALIPMIVFYIQIGVKRLHDMGWSGWLLLLSLLPYVGAAFSVIPGVGDVLYSLFSIAGGVFSIIMLVVPGSHGANRFGPPPPPNSRGVKILASLWLLVPVFGILAAIAIPAYQDYTERAQSALQSSYDAADSAEAAEAYAPLSEDE